MKVYLQVTVTQFTLLGKYVSRKFILLHLYCIMKNNTHKTNHILSADIHCIKRALLSCTHICTRTPPPPPNTHTHRPPPHTHTHKCTHILLSQKNSKLYWKCPTTPCQNKWILHVFADMYRYALTTHANICKKFVYSHHMICNYFMMFCFQILFIF